MVNLPLLRRLSVRSYQLYPGTAEEPGLEVDLQSGLTLVLGANGLGKTTLVTMLYRLAAGPVDIPRIDTGAQLGDRRLDSRNIPPWEVRTFANRVTDEAREARATLTYQLGSIEVSVTRRLTDLAVDSLIVGGRAVEPNQQSYEQEILRASGVTAYGDWILILRLLTFYFEDRRALVWDPTAQRQLLRLLFLSPERAEEWRQTERQIIELDSHIRNVQYTLGRETKSLAKKTRQLSSAGEVRQRLALLQEVQRSELEELEELGDRMAAAAAERQIAIVNSLTSEQELESNRRNVERIQLMLIERSFPSASATTRYLVSHILAKENCLTCGSEVTSFAQEIASRIQSNLCPVCGSNFSDRHDHLPSDDELRTQLATAITDAARVDAEAQHFRDRQANASREYVELVNRIAHLNAQTSERSPEIDLLIRSLPPDEQELHDQRGQLAGLRARLEHRRQELTNLRTDFDSFVQDANAQIAEQKDAIKASFDSFADDFLLEESSLEWAPQRHRVGETGPLIEFGGFELSMSGGTFSSPFRRSGPAQVSESQREFIDLSFRMALMSVTTPSGASLIIDAPESSLDAVFVKRAARLFTKFANARSGNQVFITSNLIDGDLIPELIRLGEIQSQESSRIVDLLKIAAPTAATREWHDDYQNVRDNLFLRAGLE